MDNTITKLNNLNVYSDHKTLMQLKANEHPDTLRNRC